MHFLFFVLSSSEESMTLSIFMVRFLVNFSEINLTGGLKAKNNSRLNGEITTDRSFIIFTIRKRINLTNGLTKNLFSRYRERMNPEKAAMSAKYRTFPKFR